MRRYWDSCAFLALLENEPGTADACAETLQDAQQGEFIILTSALTVAETLWLKDGPRLSSDKADMLNAFFKGRYIRVVNVDRRIAQASQALVWDNGVRPKDAIHVATALLHDCPILETFDRALIAKGRDIAGLTVREPQRARQPSLELVREPPAT